MNFKNLLTNKDSLNKELLHTQFNSKNGFKLTEVTLLMFKYNYSYQLSRDFKYVKG